MEGSGEKIYLHTFVRTRRHTSALWRSLVLFTVFLVSLFVRFSSSYNPFFLSFILNFFYFEIFEHGVLVNYSTYFLPFSWIVIFLVSVLIYLYNSVLYTLNLPSRFFLLRILRDFLILTYLYVLNCSSFFNKKHLFLFTQKLNFSLSLNVSFI